MCQQACLPEHIPCRGNLTSWCALRLQLTVLHSSKTCKSTSDADFVENFWIFEHIRRRANWVLGCMAELVAGNSSSSNSSRGLTIWRME